MPSQSTGRNAFLAELPAADYELFRPHLTSCTLTADTQLQSLGATVEEVIFPHSGLVAMTMPPGGGKGGGAILVGRESMMGAFAAAATASAMCDAKVVISGRAARMPVPAFRYVHEQRPSIRGLIARHTAALMLQAHQAAFCNAAHPQEARVARLLLEVQERCDDPAIRVTQATLAQMVGVVRTTLMLVVGRLEAMGVIDCRRGEIKIIRRDELERCACECHSQLKSRVSRLFAEPVIIAVPSGKPAQAVGRKARR